MSNPDSNIIMPASITSFKTMCKKSATRNFTWETFFPPATYKRENIRDKNF